MINLSEEAASEGDWGRDGHGGVRNVSPYTRLG